MRNAVVIQVINTKYGCAVHFGAPEIRQEPTQMISIQVNSERSTKVPAPEKLQGIDHNLYFPLVATTQVDLVNFEEIEKIMQLNNVAHNVTSITPLRRCGDSMDYNVVYNEPEKQKF